MVKINSFKVGIRRSRLIPIQRGARGSINAKMVAEDVKSMVAKGSKVVLSKVIRERGYSEAIARQPHKVTKQLAYKEVMDPVVNGMTEEREAILKAFKSRRNRANYRDLMDGLDKLTKNIQLLTGKDTERRSDVREYMDALNKLMAERMK